MTSFSRYEYSGRFPAERCPQSVREDAQRVFPDGLPIGNIFDDAGMVVSAIESKECGLGMLDGAVRDGRISADNAMRVRDEIMRCGELTPTLYTFEMSVGVDEDGRPFAVASPFTADDIKSKDHGRKVVADGITKRMMHPDFRQEHLSRVERLPLPETLIAVERIGDRQYAFIDRNGYRQGTFQSGEEGRATLNVALQHGHIRDDELSVFRRSVDDLVERGEIDPISYRLEAVELANGQPCLKLTVFGAEYTFPSINFMLMTLRTLRDAGVLDESRFIELSETARRSDGIPESITQFVACGNDHEPHVHVVSEDGTLIPGPIFSLSQARLLLPALVTTGSIAEESMSALGEQLDRSNLPQTHITDALITAMHDLVGALTEIRES